MPPASSAADARRAERRRRQQLLDGATVVAEPATEPAAVSMQSELNISSNVVGADSALARRRAARKARQAALDAWENGNSQLEELVETAEAAVSEVEGIVVEAWDGDEDDDDDAERRREHVEEQIEEARSIAGSLEF